MESFAGKLAVVTGGGGGIGRELVIQLAREGCSVAAIDLVEDAAATSVALASESATGGARVTAHACDITNEVAVGNVRDEICAAHRVRHVNLLLNNAGIFGAGSFIHDDRAAWERVFNVCWTGVYTCCRVFVPLVIAASEGHIVNTSSVNALRAVHGPGAPSTAYSAGKWAVRGFTEALIEDVRTHAPHVGVSLVMPGGVGTDIRANSGRILRESASAGAQITSGAEHLRLYLTGMGVPVDDLDDDALSRLMALQQSDVFAMPPAQAAADILHGVREGRWRILVGVGATELDEAVRETPETIYDHDGPSLLNRDMLIGLMVLASRFSSADGGADGVYELRLDSSPIFCRVRDGKLSLDRVTGTEADLVLESDPPIFRELIMHERTLDDVVATGDATLAGDPERFEALLRAVTL